ncbi:MAG: hypothetical protein JO232_06925 [Verrucomicrobia bacterium]|nr:hypothetical protein [Verrucomicrobiota bacterium]
MSVGPLPFQTRSRLLTMSYISYNYEYQRKLKTTFIGCGGHAQRRPPNPAVPPGTGAGLYEIPARWICQLNGGCDE